jgi:hypothetical protein
MRRLNGINGVVYTLLKIINHQGKDSGFFPQIPAFEIWGRVLCTPEEKVGSRTVHAVGDGGP